MYKDSNGNVIQTGLLEKDKIPKNIERKIYKMNICDNRIRSLNSMDVDDKTKEVKLHPKVCGINLNKDGSVKNLAEEPGMTELMQLYLDDNYDYSNGTFTGMSESTRKQFEKDLKIFYTAFTGNENMPADIKKFSDIKLRDYNSKNSCQGENAAFKQNYNLSENDKLFKEYAKNIQTMIQSASDKQNELLGVINELFIFVDDPYSDKKKIRVHPKLNEEKLQKLVERTRNIIIELYVKCEMDYVNNLKVYEAIVESKILETTKKQIENLEKKAEIIINDTSVKMKQPMPMPQAVAPGVQYVPSNVGAVQLPPPIPRPTN
jgi:hypothetical protein